MSYLQMYSTGVCYVLFRWDMAWGKKLFLCLAVLVLSDLLHRPEGNSSKREWAGCEGSRVTFLALFLILEI